MRLRNIPRAKGVLEDSSIVIKEEEKYQGKWEALFENTNPIYIELGMGKGQFITAHAVNNPRINYIGVERYTSVLLRSVERLQKEGLDKELHNLKLICMDAMNLNRVFEKDEIDRIYLNFSDPWPKAKHSKRRLTSSVFLNIYNQVLKPGGLIEFKTDNKELFEFSLEEIKNSSLFELLDYTYDLHNEKRLNEGNILTEYEEKFSSMGNPIYKLIASK